MENRNVFERYRGITECLLEQGCEWDKIEQFFHINQDYFNQLVADEKQRLYFIYNGDKMYAALFVQGDAYWWSLYHNCEFQPFRGSAISEDSRDPETDFIVEMMLNIATGPKVRNVVPGIDSMDIEQRVKILKKIGLNSDGYHVK